ncbi:MAG: serine/threonine protein kinase [Chitinispirillales bacterium]|jgi:serine/threonine protein kinase|nr:serine/threonine protein kinase [Chitinispirillales bacterium]
MHILDDSEIEKTVVERESVFPTPRPAAFPARPLIGQTRINGSSLVVDTIGAGGMASVYKVWNERLELFRAVKMLSLDTLYARFETEAKITAKLRHPHIVEVYSAGEWNGVPYMEMEYVDGCNLQEALETRGRFPDAVCCAAGLCIASALNYAHTLKFTLGGNSYDGIIHRDLKPANIIVSKHSEIKLTDFGIARPAQTSLHTIDGNIVGTLHYLSPEQLGNGKIDPRSDIYSFGAILYEMATGVKTFPQKSITELTMHRAANSFKSPYEYDIPAAPSISNIILKCLKASAQERYQNAAELIGDLQRAYAKITGGNAPQKTLYKFFSGNAEDAVVTPTALINVDINIYAGTNIDNDDAVNTNVNTVDTVNTKNADTDGGANVDVDADNNTGVNTNINSIDIVDTVDKNNADNNLPSAKPPVKWPLTKRTTLYASAALIAVLSASYPTIRQVSRPSPKKDGIQSTAATKFFSTPVNTDSTGAAVPDVFPSANTSARASTTPVNNTIPSKAVNIADTDTVDANITDISVSTVNTGAAADGTDTGAPSTPVNINMDVPQPVNTHTDAADAAVHAKTATQPPAPITESALIKSAAEAIGRKEWDRAVRILEKNAPAFTERRGERHLLLLEACVESRQLDKARSVLDDAATTNDALYFLTAGRYYFYRGDHTAALAALEASLTRPSALRSRGAVFDDAMYYIALIRSDRFKASPTETTRKQAQDAWKRVKSAYESKPETPQFKRAEAEILELY